MQISRKPSEGCSLGFQAVVSLSLSLAALVNGASAHPEAGKPPKMTIGAMEVGEHFW